MVSSLCTKQLSQKTLWVCITCGKSWRQGEQYDYVQLTICEDCRKNGMINHV